MQDEYWPNIEKPEPELGDQSSTVQQLNKVRGDLKVVLSSVPKNYSFYNESEIESTERVRNASPIATSSSIAQEGYFDLRKKLSF